MLKYCLLYAHPNNPNNPIYIYIYIYLEVYWNSVMHEQMSNKHMLIEMSTMLSLTPPELDLVVRTELRKRVRRYQNRVRKWVDDRNAYVAKNNSGAALAHRLLNKLPDIPVRELHRAYYQANPKPRFRLLPEKKRLTRAYCDEVKDIVSRRATRKSGEQDEQDVLEENRRKVFSQDFAKRNMALKEHPSIGMEQLTQLLGETTEKERKALALAGRRMGAVDRKEERERVNDLMSVMSGKSNYSDISARDERSLYSNRGT